MKTRGENIVFLFPKEQDSVDPYDPAARYFGFHNFEYKDSEMLDHQQFRLLKFVAGRKKLMNY